MILENINFWKISEDVRVFDSIDDKDKLKLEDFFLKIEVDTHEDVFDQLWSEEFIKKIDNIEDVVSFFLWFWRFLSENIHNFSVGDLLANVKATDSTKNSLSKIFSKESNYYQLLILTYTFDKFTDLVTDFHHNTSVSYWDNNSVFVLSELRFKHNNSKLKINFSKESAIAFKNQINNSLDKIILEIEENEKINKARKYKIIK